jgi:rubrerythrin
MDQVQREVAGRAGGGRMTNAELIEALRLCGSPDAVCKGQCPYYGVENCLSKKDLDAADALEADDKRIVELEVQLAGSKDAIRILKHNLEMKKPKEGEWIHGRELWKEWVYDHWVAYFEDWRCSNCGVVFEQESEPKYHYCPNCGARMKGKQE